MVLAVCCLDVSLEKRVDFVLSQVNTVWSVPAEKAFRVVEQIQSLCFKLLGPVGDESDWLPIFECRRVVCNAECRGHGVED